VQDTHKSHIRVGEVSAQVQQTVANNLRSRPEFSVARISTIVWPPKTCSALCPVSTLRIPSRDS